jgi:hypothetical protein
MSPTVLSSQGLDRAVSASESDFDLISNGFEFIGHRCRLKYTLFQAVFISPRLHCLLQQDKALNSFSIAWESQEMNENRVFKLLHHLMTGWPIEPLPSEVEGLCEVATVLGNTELLDSFIRDEDQITQSTVFGRLRLKSVVGRPTDKEIAFAAAHFREFDSEN